MLQLQEQIYQMQSVYISELGRDFLMSTYLHNKFLIVSFFEEGTQISYQTVMELNAIINKHSLALVNKLQSNIEKIKNPKDVYRYLYFNNVNFSLKISNSFDY